MTEVAPLDALLREVAAFRENADEYLAAAPHIRAELSALLAKAERLAGRPTLKLVHSAEAPEGRPRPRA